MPSLVPTILAATYIYKERSSNTNNYRAQIFRTEAMGISDPIGRCQSRYDLVAVSAVSYLVGSLLS